MEINFSKLKYVQLINSKHLKKIYKFYRIPPENQGQDLDEAPKPL